MLHLNLNFESLSKTVDYGPPCHGDGTLRDLNSSSHIGNRLDGFQDTPAGSRTPASPSRRYAFHTTCRYTSYQSPSIWPAWRILQEVWVEGGSRGGRSPLQGHQKLRASKGAIDGLRGACGKGFLLCCHLLLLQSHWCCGGGGMVGSLWGRAQRRGSLSALHTIGRRSWLTSFMVPGVHKVH